MHHFTWVSDPGHAWLQVEADLINDLQWTNISKYSYHDDEYVYLEEDSDAPKFLESLYAKGIAVAFSETEQENEDSIVRNMARCGQ